MPQVKEKEPIASKKGPTTTIQITLATKRKLDALRAKSDASSYDETLTEAINKATRPAIGDELADDVMDRLESLEEVVHMLLTDPRTGYVFHATASPKAQRGTDVKRGAWVTAPSHDAGLFGNGPVILTEVDGSLPDEIVELIEREEKVKARKARGGKKAEATIKADDDDENEE
jgi:hypothetical protein